MTPNPLIDRAAAGLLIVLTALFAAREWGAGVPGEIIEGLSLLVLLLLGLNVRLTRKAFILVGLALTLWLALTGEDWLGHARRGLEKAAFVAAFFVALSTLRNVAETSPALRKGGAFLAAQPPGRRYGALTIGGHLFALLINYGSISLLGSLASNAARAEADPVIRGHRTRRMLLAIQRGFIASLPWSPLAFSLAITTALIPGASWAGAAVPGVISAVIITMTGWAMDSIFKPRLGRPAPKREVEGSWSLMLPLVLLLFLLAGMVSGAHFLTGIRVVGVVMVVVPAIAAVWAVIQRVGLGREGSLRGRARGYVTGELPGYRGEIVLLMMAGYIGTVGAPVLQPLLMSLGFSPEALPTWAVLVILVWIVPVLGQFGMNPILAVTLISPLFPSPEALGIPPAAMVAAITAGWAMSGATSPFTATTLLIGSFGGVSATHVGLRWNGVYFLVATSILTGWVLLFGLVLG